MKVRVTTGLLSLVGVFCAPTVAGAQGPPRQSPVRFTEVVELEVRRSVRLPGSVESRDSSRVAAEVQGLVERLVVGGCNRRPGTYTSQVVQFRAILPSGFGQ